MSNSTDRPDTAQMVRKSYKYKLKPTPTQARALEEVVWRCRVLYNAGLQERKEAWEKCHVTITRFQQAGQLKEIRAEHPEYAAIHSHVLQDVLARLDKAYQAFFRRVQRGEKPGYPRFQGRDRYHSFTYMEYGNGARLDTGFLVLSKIGRIGLRWSHPLEGTPKTITLSKEADGWYCCLSCAEVPLHPLPLTGNEVGIDVGIEAFYVDSNGKMSQNPKFLRQAEAKLRCGQRKLERCQKGSNRHKRVKQQVAKQHQTVKRQRLDFHHQEAKMLVKENDVIYVEDLQVANMVRNHALATSISDTGWAQFRAVLAYKAACAGKQVVAVPPQYTSQMCSRCGAYVQKSLSVRTHVCPVCGLVLDRDHNGAINVLQAGQAQRTQRTAEERGRADPSGGNVAGCRRRSLSIHQA